MWGQLPGDVRQKQGFRKAFSGPVVNYRNLKVAKQNFSSTKVSQVRNGKWGEKYLWGEVGNKRRGE